MSANYFSRLALASIFCVTCAFAALPAQGQTPTVIYTFSGTNNTPRNPNDQAIAQGRNGNLYFTTCIPLSTDSEMFDITTAGTPSMVYTPSNCSYGVTLGTDGNLYSTTGNNDGGNSIWGTIYKVTPGGVATTLHTFTNGADGSYPYWPPIEAASGIFYGVTSNQAVDSTAYSVTSGGTFTTLHTFTGPDGQNISSLVQGSDGNFYGASVLGGTSNDGVIFRMTPAGAVTVLHNFAGTDGSQGYWPLMQAKDGNFYGTARSGGTNGAGVLFKMTPAGVYTVLYNFPSTGNPASGEFPYSGLIQATNNLLYGVTSNHQGPWGWGSLYSYNITTATFTSLYSFSGDAVGGQPSSPLLQMTDGLIYGTTYVGGNNADCTTVENDGELVGVGGCGTVFSLDIDAKPFVSLVSTSGKVGSKIGILGQGFSASSVVKFNGVAATTVTRTGTTFLLATVPAGASDGFVTVTTGATTLTSSKKFIVHNSWASGKAMPTAAICPAVGYIGGKIYVAGGSNGSTSIATNQVYSVAANTWSTAAAMPTSVGCAAYAVVNGILYVIGGSNGSTITDLVQAYNPVTNTWSTKSPMPTARTSIPAAVVDGTSIYVMGGNGSTLRLDSVEKYNTTTNTWSEESPLLVGRSETTGALLGTTIVSSDGDINSGPTGDTEAYDVATNSWRELTPDPTPRGGPCAGALLGQLYLAGGSNSSAAAISVTESFNLSTNKWTAQASLPNAVMWPGSVVANGQLYCFGGTPAASGTTADTYVQIYQP